MNLNQTNFTLLQCCKRLPATAAGEKETKYGTILEAEPILQSSADMDSSIDKPYASGKCNVSMNGKQNSLIDEDSTREPKRQKKLNFGLHDTVNEFSLLIDFD